MVQLPVALTSSNRPKGLKRRSQKFYPPTGPQGRWSDIPRPSGRQEEIPIFNALIVSVLLDAEPHES
eukprot:4897544-Pyramimonas_sp.AAC.1